MFKINNKLYSKFGYIFISIWMSVPRYFNGNEVSNKINIESGEVKIFISSAHIYEQDFNKFND